jgi:D-alanyl-D-alanine carboxypeptidase
MRFGVIPTASGIPLSYGLGITRLGDWVGHNGAIYGFSTETLDDRTNGAEITATANLSSNFSESTTELFVKLADDLYPGSLRRR